MTRLISAKRPVGWWSVRTGYLIVSLLLLAAYSPSNYSVSAASDAEDKAELPANIEAVGDEARQLDDEQLGSIVKDFGEHLKDTIEDEMDKLINEVKQKRPSKRQKLSEAQLDKLKATNQAIGKDIKARIELASDNSGALPQGLGRMASSFAAAASDRLHAAGSYIGNKMSSLGNSVAAKVPSRLRRFFKWPTFLRFKIRFHKTYKSLREELYRQMIFLHSHVVVGMQHVRFLLGRDKHLTGPNQYSDWTEKEYHEREGNHEAEADASQLEPGSDLALNKKSLAKLQKLALEGKNIFGQPIVAGTKKSRKRRAAVDSRRIKRNSDDDEMFDNELDDSEDEDDFDGMELGNDLNTEDNEIDDPESKFKLIEEFANGVDLDNLDDLDEDIDNALNLNDNFKPIDLRDTGCIIKAENQNGCGCCYSYAMNAAASYYNCMQKKAAKPDRYHARFVSDCGKYLTPADKYPALNGCHGGRISKAYQFVQMLGVQRFANYNIARVSAKVSDTDTCAYPRPQQLAEHNWPAAIEPVDLFRQSRFTLLKLEEVDLHLRTIGPVLVNVRTWRNFKFYEGGIFDSFEESESSTLHSMLIVGHSKDSRGRKYWIILNSHGIVWGEHGFLMIYHEALEYFGVIYGGLAPLDV